MKTRSKSLRWGAAAGLACLVTLLGACKTINDTRIEDEAITMDEIREVLADQAKRPDKDLIIMLDARRGSQFQAGALPQARLIDLGQISLSTRRVDPKIEKFDLKVVYGNNPADSIAKAVAKKMLEGGYSGVRWFRGGYEEWMRVSGATTVPQRPGAVTQ